MMIILYHFIFSAYYVSVMITEELQSPQWAKSCEVMHFISYIIIALCMHLAAPQLEIG